MICCAINKNTFCGHTPCSWYKSMLKVNRTCSWIAECSVTIEQFLYSLIDSNGCVTPILIWTFFGKICLLGDHALVAEAVFIVLIARVQENQARA